MGNRTISSFQLSVSMAAALLVAACGGGGSDHSVVESKNPLVVDVGFGGSGKVRIALGAFNGSVDQVLEQSDGKLLVAGYRKLAPSVVSGYSFGVRPESKVFVNRYLGDGQLDASFGTNGSAEFSVRGADQTPIVSLAGDGNIYVSVNASKPCHFQYGGSVNLVCVNDNVVEPSKRAWVRISDNGVADTGAPGEGLDVSQLPASIQAQQQPEVGQRVNLQDGKYLVLKTFRYPVGGIYGWTLRRYLANGELDAQFGTDGAVSSRCGADAGRMLLDQDKNIWVVGANRAASVPQADRGLCIEKLSTSGQPSGSTPAPITTALGADVSIQDAQFLSDGALMVAVITNNDSTHAFKALKYQASGVLVAGYGTQGIADLKGLNTEQTSALSLRIKDGAGAIAGLRQGSRYAPNDLTEPNLWVQWKSDATLDKNYGQDGVLSLGDLPSYSQRRMVLTDSRKRWLLQTNTSEGPSIDSAGVVTLTRYAGDSQ